MPTALSNMKDHTLADWLPAASKSRHHRPNRLKPAPTGPIPRSLTPGLDRWVLQQCTRATRSIHDLDNMLQKQIPGINFDSLRGCVTKLVKAGLLSKHKGPRCSVLYATN